MLIATIFFINLNWHAYAINNTRSPVILYIFNLVIKMSSLTTQMNASSKPKSFTATVEVDTQAVGFLLGKGRKNLNAITDSYATLGGVNIRIVPNGAITDFIIIATNIGIVEQCKGELENLREKALNTLNTVQFRNRLEKEKDEKRRSIQAANRIRESIENEMKTRHREDVIKKLSADIGDVTVEGDVYIATKKNKYAGLELE